MTPPSGELDAAISRDPVSAGLSWFFSEPLEQFTILEASARLLSTCNDPRALVQQLARGMQGPEKTGLARAWYKLLRATLKPATMEVQSKRRALLVGSDAQPSKVRRFNAAISLQNMKKVDVRVYIGHHSWQIFDCNGKCGLVADINLSTSKLLHPRADESSAYLCVDIGNGENNRLLLLDDVPSMQWGQLFADIGDFNQAWDREAEAITVIARRFTQDLVRKKAAHNVSVQTVDEVERDLSSKSCQTAWFSADAKTQTDNHITCSSFARNGIQFENTYMEMKAPVQAKKRLRKYRVKRFIHMLIENDDEMTEFKKVPVPPVEMHLEEDRCALIERPSLKLIPDEALLNSPMSVTTIHSRKSHRASSYSKVRAAKSPISPIPEKLAMPGIFETASIIQQFSNGDNRLRCANKFIASPAIQ